ncbi:hypothetical protein FE782_20660 [Paenibacillus antri]|uniref:Fucose 4-O-acetylase n=1 Tax=Paenibacillus antri TaxID=2582848 RepID=A0A5R9GAM2_9BACL|nr:hypothetical protein [Paenibacillus antri]TLS50438.1 hypothetical protein FE782_20660 [Paenibacillus antri]
MNKTAEQQGNGETLVANGRFWLISLVFAANLLEPAVRDIPLAKSIHLWIVMFHIPAFAFAMGYYAKNFTWNEKGVGSLQQILLQYAVFQTIYSAADAFVFRTPDVLYSFFFPFGLLWFLTGHLFWKLLLLPFRKIPAPVLTAAALGVGIGLAAMTPNWLGLSRTLVFFPFFLAGHAFDYERFSRLREHRFAVPAAWLALSALMVLAFQGAFDVSASWWYGNAGYEQLGASPLQGVLTRAAMYVVSAVGVIAFWFVVPTKRSFFTERGKLSVFVFLLHGLLVKTIVWIGVYRWIEGDAWAPALAAAGVLGAVLLSHPAVAKATRPIVEPNPESWRRAFAGLRAVPFSNKR